MGESFAETVVATSTVKINMDAPSAAQSSPAGARAKLEKTTMKPSFHYRKPTDDASIRSMKLHDEKLTAWSTDMVDKNHTVTGVAIARFVYAVLDADGPAESVKDIMNSQMEAWRVVLLFDTLVTPAPSPLAHPFSLFITVSRNFSRSLALSLSRALSLSLCVRLRSHSDRC